METLIPARHIVSDSSLQSHVEKISIANNKQDIFNLCSSIAQDLETSYFT